MSPAPPPLPPIPSHERGHTVATIRMRDELVVRIQDGEDAVTVFISQCQEISVTRHKEKTVGVYRYLKDEHRGEIVDIEV